MDSFIPSVLSGETSGSDVDLIRSMYISLLNLDVKPRIAHQGSTQRRYNRWGEQGNTIGAEDGLPGGRDAVNA